ncbi:hypothetical protein [Massilia sp. TWR1-2-2]|uniref:hypothetical protein n=1 Tax=Massilia sp. TWR1-2-2 TaxID=2804584 RepID=UPI003CE6A6CC
MIRKAVAGDHAQLVALYRLVAATPDAIARTPGEVTDDYVGGFMRRAAADGVELVWEEGGRMLGEIDASGPGIASLSHLLAADHRGGATGAGARRRPRAVPGAARRSDPPHAAH